MRLSEQEFRGMNNPFRRWLHRTVEFPMFRRMGFTGQGQDILEIGCGSGYGAALLLSLHPRSYIGVDLMPEMIALARQRELPGATFAVADASRLTDIEDASKDTVVIFGVLHHIPAWREVLQECYRVLRPGGALFVEEPDGKYIAAWDRIFPWSHPTTFTFRQLEDTLAALGFTVCQRQRFMIGFSAYSARKP